MADNESANNQIPQAPTSQPAPIDQQYQNVNVFNPEGALVSIPQHQVQEAMATGYRPATQADIQQYSDTQKYGSTSQQAITALEGAGQGVAGPIAPALEESLGVDPEAIRKRAEVNPTTHYGSQMAGLAGSMLLGTGEGALLAKAGEAGATALGLGEVATTGAKIGSAAVRSAIENMLLQGSDEATKMITQDPSQSAQTAIANIGLSGLLGGTAGAALGSVSPLWKATVGSKVAGLLDALHSKIGVENAPIADDMAKSIQLSGIDIQPEVKAALSTNPGVKQAFQALQESSTGAGLKAQEALKNFKGQIADTIVNSLGKTPEEVANLGSLSEYETGQYVKKSLIDRLKSTIEPLSDQFTKIKNKYAAEPLAADAVDGLANKVGELAQSGGYDLSPSSPQGALIQRVLKEVPNLSTLEDLRKYQSIIGDSTFANPELRRIGGQLKGIFRNVEDDTAMNAAGRISPDAIQEHASARLAYKNAMDVIDNLNDRLHVGRYAGPGSFISALKEMPPEDVLRRLNPKGDADLISQLNTHFPEASNQVRDYHVSKMLSIAANRAGEGQSINSAAFFTGLNKLPPEMKQFLMGPETTAKLSAIEKLVDGIPSKMNTSGTAKTLDSLWKHVPASALGMATMLAGHNPAIGLLVGAVTKLMSRDVPDAVKLSLLRFLGSAKPIESEGFASMVDFIDHSIKGENLVGRATKNVFRSGVDVLPSSQMPTDKDLSKLDKQLKALQTDQKPLLGVGGGTGHYMPEHGTAIGETAANAVNILNNARPSTARANPLDSAIKPSVEQLAAYKRTLGVAQQPLSVLDRVKKGTITPSDVQSVQTLYPSLYNKMTQQLMNQVIEISKRGETIPYTTRIGLSLFMKQPLDSTMLPASILATQPQNQQQPQRNAASSSQTVNNAQGKALDKMPALYQTGLQRHQSQKLQPGR